MADKSCYMGAGGYGSGYMGQNASSSGYAREDYAYGSGGNNNNNGASSGNASGGSSNPPGVFKPRTDQSCYLGPN